MPFCCFSDTEFQNTRYLFILRKLREHFYITCWIFCKMHLLGVNWNIYFIMKFQENLCFSSQRLILEANSFMHLILTIHCRQEYFWGIFCILLFFCVILVSDGIKQWLLGLELFYVGETHSRSQLNIQNSVKANIQMSQAS